VGNRAKGFSPEGTHSTLYQHVGVRKTPAQNGVASERIPPREVISGPNHWERGIHRGTH